MALSRRLRFEILRRDGYTCRYCGAKAPDATLTVDHVIPVTLGGGDEPNNLVTACRDCNAGKSSSSADQALVEDVDAAALLFAKALEKAAAIRRRDRAAIDSAITAFDDEWRAWTTPIPGGDREPIQRPDDWRMSVERFIALGLTTEELLGYVHDAMTTPNARNPFRLFCSKAWNELTARTELARRLIEDEQV